MERFYYEVPSLERREDAIQYIQEFYDFSSPINGTGGLQRYLEDYEAWLLKLEEDRECVASKDRVPAETYFLVRESDQKIIGMANIRLELNERLRKSGGHIGYSIRPTERRHGYNKINLYLALHVLEEHGVDVAMLSCDKSNLGSSRTMISLGGVLDREFVEEDGNMEQVYFIPVSDSIEKYDFVYRDKVKSFVAVR